MPAETPADAPTDQALGPTDAPSPDREITLEEWIAAGQACCGADAGG